VVVRDDRERVELWVALVATRFVGAVGLHGLLRDLQHVGDLAVGVGLRDQLHHLHLARGQLVGPLGAVLEPLLHQRLLGARVEEGAAVGHGTDSVDLVRLELVRHDDS